MLYIVRNAGWSPRSYDRWDTSDGSSFVVTGKRVSPDLVASCLIDAYFLKDLGRAGQHFNGKGIEAGVDMNTTLSLVRKYAKEPDMYSFRCAIETVIAGACWPASRVAEIHPHFELTCPRCGALVEDSLHTFYLCPSNNNIEDPAVSQTQTLIQAAVAEAESYPCLWFRGVLPASLAPVPEIEYWPPAVYIGDLAGA